MSDDLARDGRFLRVSIAYKPIFFKLTESVEATLLLSQMWFWNENGIKTVDGQFWKTRRQWERETGLTRRQQDTARRLLTRLGFITEPEVIRGKPKQFIVNTLAVLSAITAYKAKNETICNKEFPIERNEKTNIRSIKDHKK